jgi:hypothetical protein
MKDWSIILVKNTKGTILQVVYWWLIRFFTRADYNHAQLVRKFNGRLYICESDVSGFRVTKTLDKWYLEQEEKQRVYSVINLPNPSLIKFNKILGNKYDLHYWTYLTKSFSNMKSSNCFQSISYIFGIPKYWLATANTLLNSYNNLNNVQHDNKDI